MKTVENSIGLVTALTPKIGYEKATMVAKRAQANDASVKDTVIELGYLTLEEFDAILGDLESLIGPTAPMPEDL